MGLRCWFSAIRSLSECLLPPFWLQRSYIAPDDPLRGTWTVTALGPGLAACFVARETEPGTYELATSYDRDLVVESALLIMARLRPLAPPGR